VGSYVIGIVLSLFIYKTVVKKDDLSYESNKRFFWTVVIFYLVYSTLYVIVVGVVAQRGGYTMVDGCNPAQAPASLIGLVQSILSLLIEIVLLGSTLKYILLVIAKVRQPTHSHRSGQLAIRFFIIVVCQTLPRVYIEFLHLSFSATGTASNLTTDIYAYYVISSLCFLISATVVLVGNQKLRNWISKKYHRFRNITLTSRSRSHSSLGAEKENSIEIQCKPGTVTVC